MLFKKSTRSIVAGKRPRPPKVSQGQDSAPERPEEPQTAKNTSKEDTIMDKLNIPRWAYWAAGAAAAVLLIVIIILALLPKGNSTPEDSEGPVLPEIRAGQTVISVQADAALTALAEPGDIVQLYTADGAVVDELKYLQVYQAAEDGCLLLLVNSEQAAAIVSHKLSAKVVLVSHNSPERAGELLALQEQIIDPQITLELQPTASLALSQTTRLTYHAEIAPSEATLPDIQWSSSNTSVVAVRDGMIQALGVGEATVTAKCGNKESTCIVTVQIPLKEIRLDQHEAVLAVGESLTLAARPEPEDATQFNASWSVSDPAIATVSEDGIVTAIAPGTVVVKATSGGVSAECTIRVGYHAEVVQLSLQSISLSVGQEYKLEPSVYPSNDLIDELEYSSSNILMATVSEDGTVTALAMGTATITIQCGDISVKCTVTITQ